MRKIAIILLLQLLVGCTFTPFIIDVQDIDTSESINMLDLRPEYESESTLFSSFSFSDAFAIYRSSDLTTEPTRLRFFQHRTYEKLAHNNELIELKVYHFVSYTNTQAALKSQSLGAVLGAAGTLISSSSYDPDLKLNFNYSEIDREQFESANGDNEYTRGQYSQSENPTKVSVFITYIDAEINGERKIIRSISPTISDNETKAYVNALNDTVSAFLEGF